MPDRINFIELSAATTTASKAFYAAAFDFSMTDFGPTYAWAAGVSTSEIPRATNSRRGSQVDDLTAALSP